MRTIVLAVLALALTDCTSCASGEPLTSAAAGFGPGVDPLPIAGAAVSDSDESASETRWATLVFIVRLRNDKQQPLWNMETHQLRKAAIQPGAGSQAPHSCRPSSHWPGRRHRELASPGEAKAIAGNSRSGCAGGEPGGSGPSVSDCWGCLNPRTGGLSPWSTSWSGARR